MPYARNADLPESVRNALPSEAQTVFRSAFNAFLENNPDASEESAFRVAWAAVRRGWRPPRGDETKWQPKETNDSVPEKLHITGDGIFQGYVCKYNTRASSGEIILSGAFDEVMREKRPEEIRMLWQHETDKPIGRWLEWSSDNIGLWMKGKLALDAELGREAKALIEAGAIDGLSIGFEPIVFNENGDDIEIVQADLFEVSLVTFPAIEEAIVDSVTLFDKVPLGDVRRTGSGYLTTVAKVARTGIQVYLGREIGRPDLDRVRVYRPPNEVFDEKAMYSIAHQPVTLDHPPEAVTSKNWKKYAVGQIGGEIDGRDGKFIQVPLVLMDEAAIAAVEGGKRELSMGYTAQLKWGAGKTEDGEVYDAIQTSIRANHLAVVTEARGGSKLRIGDTAKGDRKMSDVKMTTIMVDGQPVEVADISARTVLSKLGALEEELRSLRTKLQEEQNKLKESDKKANDSAAELTKVQQAIATKDAEIAALQKKLADSTVTPQRLDQMVSDRAATVAKARSVLSTVVVDGKTDAEIRRQVVDSQLGEIAKGYTDDQVSAAFASFTKDVKIDQHTTDRLAQGIQQHAFRPGPSPVTDSYGQYDKAITSAWRRPGPVNTAQQ